MPAAWVGAAAGVLGTISSMDAADAQQQAQSQAATDARNASQQQLDFAKQQYYDNQPYTQAMQQAAVQSAGLDNSVAAQQAARSQTAWDQNQSIAGPAAQVVGLNSLGAQYLTPAQQAEMQQLQQTLSQSAYKTVPGQSTSGALSAADQARYQQLLSQQQNQGRRTTGPTGVGADAGPGLGGAGNADDNAANTLARFGGPAAGLMGAAGGAPTSEFTPAMQAELAALQAKMGPTTGASTQELDPQIQAAQAAARTRLAELQQAANQSAQQRETDKANLITGTAGKYGQQEIDLGEEAAKSGLSDAQTLQDLVRSRAQQRADANELRGTTQTNADISSAADQAQRQLLRLGGDPNKMAAMSADIANQQQLARISGGNQVAATNIANLNTADDTALGIQSSALDAARQARIGAKQAALGLNLTGQQQADTLTGNAKDTADTKLNLLAQGGANMGLGFANTSAQTAQGAISGGTAGVTNLNTASNGGLQGVNAVQAGTNGVIAGSRIGTEAGNNAFNSAQTGLSAVQKNVGSVAGSVAGSGGLSGLISKVPSIFNFGTSGNNYNGASSNPSDANYVSATDAGGFKP